MPLQVSTVLRVEGVIRPYTETITPASPFSIEPVHPWWSIYIWNDGPDEVHTFVNGGAYSFDLSLNEGREINMGAPKITEVLVTVDAGKTAQVRMDTKR